MEYKVVASKWFTNQQGCIGIVAVEDPVMDTWKAYIGIGAGGNEKLDEQLIAAYGTGLYPEHAAGFFHWLDIKKYKDS